MKSRAVRLAFLVIFVGAIATAAWVARTDARRAAESERGARAFDADGRAAAAALGDLRAAQQSYVAVGQGEAFWFARVSSLLTSINDKISSLKAAAESQDAAAALEDAEAALQDFVQVDRRARDYTTSRQLTLASDLVYSDGFDLTRRAGEGVSRALTSELTRRDAVAGALRRQTVIVMASAAGIALLVVIALTPAPRPTAAPAHADAEPQLDAPRVSAETLADLDTFGTASPTPFDVSATVDLQRMAALCADLARVTETAALPALIERAADILDASGIVLWIADPDGRELMPILVHGYSPQLASRLGTLTRDASNVTAAAYRTGLLQTVAGDAFSSGAVAAPLIAAGGTVGVMAAELRSGGEKQQQKLAAAAIVAAQLATLVGPPSARTKTEAAG